MPSETGTVEFQPNALRRKLVGLALTTPEFRAALDSAAAEIRAAARPEATEATIEGYFERVVYALLRDIGLRFNPDKEVSVARRHLARGRADSRLGALVIEYKRPSLLRTPSEREKSVAQLSEYLITLSASSDVPHEGVLTNGLVVVELTATGGVITRQSTQSQMDASFLLRLTKQIISLALTALTSTNLIRDFCGTEDDGVLFNVARLLNSTLASNQHPKTQMLQSEWEQLFRLAHEDKSKRTRIEERRRALVKIFEQPIRSAEAEYRALFALHTAYAILLKFMAYRVVSDIYLGRVQQDFRALARASDSALRAFCGELEDGSIFRSLGIVNLVEGDFFSWYCDRSQWSDSLADAVRSIIVILARYEEARSIFDSGEAVDLFRDLYQAAVPRAVRSSFGEVYTPGWLADHVIASADPNGSDWRALDPCCGSGTFVISAIAKLRRESDATPDVLMDNILSRIVGIDLHPLAVLTTRIHYFIHISAFIRPEHDEFVIPVFLGDASSIPVREVIEGVPCLRYQLKTLRTPIDCALPVSLVSDTRRFMKLMRDYEVCVQEQDAYAANSLLLAAIPSPEKVSGVIDSIASLTDELISLEAQGWNGIWARILSNFLTTACLGRFDIIVGNPPWIDWRNLPSGYRERIKSLCIDRGLFSGAGRTGGINLNVCALIAHVSINNWLADDGRLAFLMPRELAYQSSYEGWRRLGNSGFRFAAFHDWRDAGHPFEPIREDFMTFIIGRQEGDGVVVPVKSFAKESDGKACEWRTLREALDGLSVTDRVAGQVVPGSTAFTIAASVDELSEFRSLAGKCQYVGRQGVEFYPQELFLFQYDGPGPRKGTVWLLNVQRSKSKYKAASRRVLVETTYLLPLVRGAAIRPFLLGDEKVLVAFPYEASDPLRPISAARLRKESPLLLDYFKAVRGVIEKQTTSNERVLGIDRESLEFYALPRTGPYSFADTYVAFRDNTKWGATVVGRMRTPWGDSRRCVFQKHAVSICEREDGSFISKAEAHYICAIFNVPAVKRYIEASSDERSYKIRPTIYVPVFDPSDVNHVRLADLSEAAHVDPGAAAEFQVQMAKVYRAVCAARTKEATRRPGGRRREDDQDSGIARAQLAKIAADPDELVGGKELEDALAEMLR